MAFLLTEPQHLLFEDPNFSMLLRGCSRRRWPTRMLLVLMVAGTPDERRGLVGYLSGGTSTASCWSPSHAGDPLVAELLAAGHPGRGLRPRPRLRGP